MDFVIGLSLLTASMMRVIRGHIQLNLSNVRRTMFQTCLKTKGSTRHIPLIGASLWAAKRIHRNDSSYAFPRYCDGKICNANSASAALNKWMKPRLKDNAVVHSFRHSMRDRLRAVECPSDIIDQIGGWSSSSVGASYGKGYELPVLAKWMTMLEDE